MLVFITARSVGNRFNEGIYDTQISIKKMPFLEQVSTDPGERSAIRSGGKKTFEVLEPAKWFLSRSRWLVKLRDVPDRLHGNVSNI